MFALQLLPELMTQRLAWVLVHFVWQGTALAALLALSVRIGHVHRPATRYTMSLLALFLMAVCPIVTGCWIEIAPNDSLAARVSPPDEKEMTGPPDQGTAHPAIAGAIAGPTLVSGQFTITSPDEHNQALAIVEPVLNLASSNIENVNTEPVATSLSQEQPTESTRFLWRTVQPWIVIGWLIGVAILSLRLLLGWIGVSRLRRQSRPAAGWLTERTRFLAKSLRVLMPAIQLSQNVSEAIAVGFLKPMILLPITWATELPPDMLDAIIAHELAHIRRGDLWINLLQRVMETFLFYHPAIWWLSRRMRIERELCCDELVVGVTKNRLRYAETLEHVGRLSLQKTHSTLVVSITGPRTVLLERIRNILNLKPRDPSSTAWIAGAIPLLVASMILWSTVTWRPHSAQAENSPVSQSVDTVSQPEDTVAPSSIESDVVTVRSNATEKVSGSEVAQNATLNATEGETAKSISDTKTTDGKNPSPAVQPSIAVATDAETVPVTVVDVEGKPVVGISAVAFEGANQVPQKFVTDQQGQVRVPKEWIEADHFLCLVAKDGQSRLGWFDFFMHGHSNNGQKLVHGPLRLMLLPINRTIRGKLTDDFEQPIAGVPVGIEFLQHPTNFAGTHWSDRKVGDQKIFGDAITNAAGDFELNLPQGTFARLSVNHPDYVSQRISVAKDQTNASPTRLSRSAKVTGRVIDAISKIPLAGVHIGAQGHQITASDIDIQMAEKDVELALVELLKVKKANGASPNAFSETEASRLQLAHEKALQKQEKAIKAASENEGTGETTPAASELEIRAADKAVELARVEYLKVMKAHSVAPATFTDIEVLRLKLAYEKALLQKEKFTKPGSQDGGWGEATTDANGRYEIGGLHGGKFNILLLDGAKAHLTAPAHEGLIAKSGETTKADFALSVGRRVSGHVLDEITGQPVAKCSVGYYGPARPQSGGANLTSMTNQKGEFEFFVPPGASRIYIADVRPNLPESGRDIDVNADRDPEPIILKAAPKSPGGIRIFVGPPLERKVTANFGGEPLYSALEELCNEAGLTLELDGDGLKTVGYTRSIQVRADLQNVTLEDALKHVLKPLPHIDFMIEDNKVVVGTRQQIEARKKKGATVVPRSVEGIVREKSGKGIPGADVVLCTMVLIDGRYVSTVVASGHADKQGRYTLDLTETARQQWLPKSKAIVWAMAKGFGPGTVLYLEGNQISRPREDVDSDLALYPERVVDVELVDEKGQPLEVEVLALEFGGRTIPPQFTQRMIPEAFSGKIAIRHMPSGPNEGSPNVRTLTVRTKSHGQQELSWNADRASELAGRVLEGKQPIKLAARPVARITGRLMSQQGELPRELIENKNVRFRTLHGDSAMREPWVWGIAATKTDAAGEFEIPQLACGKLFEIRVDLPDSTRWRALVPQRDKIILKPGETTKIDVPLIATRTLRGQVRTSEGQGLPNVEFSFSHGRLEADKNAGTKTALPATYRESVVTDADGRFAIEVIPGDVTVLKKMSAGSDMETAADFWLNSNQQIPEWGPGNVLRLPAGTEPFDLPPIEVNVYKGILRDEIGKPTYGTLVCPGTGYWNAGLTQTREDGTFTIEVLGKPAKWAALLQEQDHISWLGTDKREVDVISESPLVLQTKPKTAPKTPVKAADSTPPRFENATPARLEDAEALTTVELHPFETSTNNPAFDIGQMKAVSIGYRAEHESALHFDRMSRDFGYGDLFWSVDTKQLVGLRGATLVQMKENFEESRKKTLNDLRTSLTGGQGQVVVKIADNPTGCILVKSHEGHVLLLEFIKIQHQVLTVRMQRLTSDKDVRFEAPADGIAHAVWGPVTDGLQAGIAYRDPDTSRPPSQRYLGEAVQVKLFVRNVSQEAKTYSWRRWNIQQEKPTRIALLDVWHPKLIDTHGQQAITGRSKIHDPGERRTATLQPTETVFVGAASMALWPTIDVGFGVFPNRQISAEVSPGRYELSTELPTELFGSPSIRTGSLQLEIVESDKTQLDIIRQLDSIGHESKPVEEDQWTGWRDATTQSHVRTAFPKGPVEFQTIRCRAFDIDTNQPVAGAVAKVAFMSFGDRSSDDLCEYDVLTRADGTFEMRIPRPLLSGFRSDWRPDYRVNITHPNYSETFDSQNLKDLQALGLISKDGTFLKPGPAPDLGTTRDPSKYASFQTVALKPARALSGRLLGADDKPLPNIPIYGSNTQGWMMLPGLPKTDGAGHFEFNVPAKMTMKLEFRAAGFGRTFVTATPDQSNLGDIRPVQGVRVTGVVLDVDGKPVPHIKVTTPAWPDQSSQPNFIYYADKDGRFQSDLLAPGEYQVEIGEISPPSERNKATISGPAPDLYVPLRVTVPVNGDVPDITVRPASATRINSTLITTVPKPAKGEMPRAIDPLFWRATVEKGERERAKLKPVQKSQAGQPVRLEVDDATGELAIKGDLQKQQDFAFNWVQGFSQFPNLVVRGKIGELAWTRTPNFLELESKTEPPVYTVKAPNNLTDVTFEPNDYIQHVQFGAGPKLFGKTFHIDQLGADRFDIKIYRYQPTTIKVKFEDADGKRIVLPENELPAGFSVHARYIREAEVRLAGGRFDTSEALMNPAVLDNDTLLRFVLPDEPIELSVTASAKEPIVKQVTLKDGETRTITIQSGPQPKWNEHSGQTLKPIAPMETEAP